MPGLLGDSMDDPRTMGILALAGNMIRGDMGGGLLGYGQAYQGAQNAAVDRLDKQQQIGLRNMQLQMAQQRMKWMGDLLGDGAAQPGAAQPGSAASPDIAASPPSALGTGTFNIPTGGQAATSSPAQGGGLVAQARALGIPDAAIRTDLVFNEGKGLAEMIYKRGTPNIDFVGNVAIDKNNVQPGFSVPTVSQNGQASQTIRDPSAPGGFRVIAPSGAVDTYGQYLTKQKEVEDKFAAPVTLPLPGGPRLMTPSAARDLAGGVGNVPKAQPGVAGNFTGDPTVVMQAIAGLKDPQERSNAYNALLNQMSSLKEPGAALQTEAEKKVAEARGDAAVNSAKVKAATEPLLSAIDQAIAINSKVPYGPYGLAEAKRDLSNLPIVGNGESAKYAGMWDQLMGQNIMNGIASSGLGRMDIPIVNAIKAANGIPMENHPQAREQMLRTLRDLVVNHQRSAENTVVNLNQPGQTTSTQPQPMQGAPKELPTNPSAKNLKIGETYSLPGGKVGVFDGLGFKVQ